MLHVNSQEGGSILFNKITSDPALVVTGGGPAAFKEHSYCHFVIEFNSNIQGFDNVTRYLFIHEDQMHSNSTRKYRYNDNYTAPFR